MALIVEQHIVRRHVTMHDPQRLSVFVPLLVRVVERSRDGGADLGQFDEPGPVFSVCGAAALYRRSTLEDAAPDGRVFDEDFFGEAYEVDESGDPTDFPR